jgi:hypothetical protein
MRFRAVDWSEVVEDVRPNPSCTHRTVTTPRPIRVRLRMAWNRTCGSSPHACTQMSPPPRDGSKASRGNAGRSANAAGRFEASPKRSTPSPSKNDGPTPKVSVRFAGDSPFASPVSSGGDSGSVEPPTG